MSGALLRTAGVLWVWWFAAATTVVWGSEYVRYKDSNQPVNVRVSDLLSRMTLEEKIGQMAQIDRTVATFDIMRTYSIGTYARIRF